MDNKQNDSSLHQNIKYYLGVNLFIAQWGTVYRLKHAQS